jgi:SAM-dependent methyltransferase
MLIPWLRIICFWSGLHSSIEYWPDPQRGIKEAYRVLSTGGLACIIGPVRPTFWLSRFFADMWMLFPTEQEYIEWFERAGFKDVELKRIGPKWYRGVRRHGLVIGCSVTGIRTESGDSPLQVHFFFMVPLHMHSLKENSNVHLSIHIWMFCSMGLFTMGYRNMFISTCMSLLINGCSYFVSYTNMGRPEQFVL